MNVNKTPPRSAVRVGAPCAFHPPGWARWSSVGRWLGRTPVQSHVLPRPSPHALPIPWSKPRRRVPLALIGSAYQRGHFRLPHPEAWLRTSVMIPAGSSRLAPSPTPGPFRWWERWEKSRRWPPVVVANGKVKHSQARWHFPAVGLPSGNAPLFSPHSPPNAGFALSGPWALPAPGGPLFLRTPDRGRRRLPPPTT